VLICGAIARAFLELWFVAAQWRLSRSAKLDGCLNCFLFKLATWRLSRFRPPIALAAQPLRKIDVGGPAAFCGGSAALPN